MPTKKDRKREKKNIEETLTNLLSVGTCECGGDLFMWLKSKPENYFKIYCSDCPSQTDVRFPSEGDVIFNGPSKLLDYLALNVYGEDEIEKHKNDPSCANNAQKIPSEESKLLKESRE